MPLFSKQALTVFTAVAFCAVALATSSRAFAAKEKAEQPSSAKSDEVPEGTPQELLAFIKAQQAAELDGTTRRARMESMRRKCEAIVTAAERIIQGKADDQMVVAAAKAEFESLGILQRLGDEEAAEKIKALNSQLKTDKRPAVANLLALHALNERAQKLNGTDTQALESFLAEVKRYAAMDEPDALISAPARIAMVALYRADKKDEALHLGRDLAQKLVKSERHDALVAAGQIASLTGDILEVQGAEKEAATFYREMVEGLAKDDGPEVRQEIEKMRDFLRKFELLGKPMPIFGRLVDGGKFDISQFKGKVVLVDFWATWCGPCVQEIPNVKEVYEKYHDRGFEVIGISLDNDGGALKEFLRNEHIPWPVLFDPDSETQPMAEKYQVSGIPLPVLIDRQGKVVSFSARGERLGELVEKLLQAKPSAAAGKKAG